MATEVGCQKCGKPMPAERLDFGFDRCSACTPQNKPKAVIVYSHKTAGVAEIVSDEVFEQMKHSSDSPESLEGL